MNKTIYFPWESKKVYKSLGLFFGTILCCQSRFLIDPGLELSVEEGGKEVLIICCILVHLPGVRLGKWWWTAVHSMVSRIRLRGYITVVGIS